MRARSRNFLLALALVFGAPAAAGVVWPNELERLEADLRLDRDVEKRRSAARALSRAPRSAVIRLVPRALADPDPIVRVAVAEAALQAQMQGIGRWVVPWLGDTERSVRLAAASVLRSSPHADAIAPLGRLLSDPDPLVRVAAARALGGSGQRAATLALLGHLDDANTDVRRAVVVALERLRDARAVVPLIGKVSDSRPVVRRHAVRALGTLGDRRGVSALLLALGDAEASVRATAVASLGRLGATDTVASISTFLQSERDEGVRRAAIEALAQLADPAALDALVAVLASNELASARHAARLLGSRGAAAVPPLAKCLAAERRPSVVERCVAALGETREMQARPLVVSALRAGATRPAVALAALGKVGDVAAIPVVLEYLEAEEPESRRAAIEAATDLLDPTHPDGRVVEPVLRALERAKKSHFERIALLRLLGKTGAASAAKVLGTFAAHADDVSTRVAAIEGLGDLRPSSASSILVDSVSDPDPRVREAAVLALRTAGDASVAAGLVEALSSASKSRREELALALLGPLSRQEDARLLPELEPLVLASKGAERDALLEAVASIPHSEALTLVASLAQGPAPARRKVAEVLAARADGQPWLVRLASDSDGSVRANAVWSLGSVGRDVLPLLSKATADRDVAVAGNAVAALARLASRERIDVAELLCAALDHPHPYVRANGLAGARVVGVRCGGRGRWLLDNDSSPVVRAAAATLLVNVRTTRQDTFALARCREDEVSGEVALACTRPTEELQLDTVSMRVVVVPAGETSTQPATPFALLASDGLMRMGLSGEAGAVYEPRMPRGVVRLRVPAPLAR